MSVNLPVTNDHGFYEFRLESIGGLGAIFVVKF